MPFMRVVRKQSRPLVARPVRPAAPAWHPPRTRPKAGLPAKREKRRAGTAVSFLLHFLILLFIISPAAVLTDPNLKEVLMGAGGAGPAGGGGGGNAGSGSIKYVKIAEAPKPAPPTPTVQEVIPPKVAEPVIPQLDLPKLETAKMDVKISTPVVGVGGGSGHDGTNGNGPGTGGGIGSGTGTGKGSGTGPGTGGGTQENYPPKMIELFVPPLPVPSSVKGHSVVMEWDISETGKVLDVICGPTGDRGFDRKLHDYALGFRFKPGTTPQGVPVRMKYSISVDF